MYFKKIVLAILILATACVPNNVTPPPMPEVHFLNDDPHAKFLWSNYYPARMLAGAPDRIIASGNSPQINAFDSKTGQAAWEIWKEQTGYISEMIAQDSVVYAAKYNELTALDAKTGGPIWDVKNLNTGNALNLLADQQNIFVQHQTGKHMIIVDSSGKVISVLDTSESRWIWSINDNVAYYTKGDSLKAFDIGENQIKWTLNVEDPNFRQSVTTENTIYLDFEDWIDNKIISAVEKSSGNVIWRKETYKNIISNLCVLDDNIYFLTSDGFLIGLDKNNGQESMKLEFSNPFILYRREEPQVTSYLIAADSKNKILAVAFGDSFQLMAIQILNP